MRANTCPSGKKQYSIPEALATIEAAKNVDGWNVSRAYWCRECGACHLTSQEATR